MAEKSVCCAEKRGARAEKIALMAGQYNKKQYAKFLKEILKGGQYEGNLALVGAEAIRDEEIIISALQHESILVNIKAVILMAKIVSDEEIIKSLSL